MNAIRAALVFVGAMFLQWWWNSHLSFWGISPQILLALTVLVAARRGPVAAMLLGYAWGLYADVLRADLFGANALLFALAGYAAGMVRRQIDLRAVGPLAAAVFLLSWAYALLFGALGQVFQKTFLWPGAAPFFVAPFLNAGIAIAAAVVWDARGDS